MQSILSTVSGLLFLAAYVPYIRAVCKCTTKPAKASWLIWSILDTITLVGMWTKGTLNGQIIGAILGGWIVVVLAFRYGIPGWSKVDKFCLFGAVLGIFLWWVFGEATMGIITNNTVIVLGSIPTFVSAWKDPTRENRTAWTLMFISCVLALIAIPEWTPADAAQPVAFTIVETIMMFLLYWPRKAKT
ncbi:hypothetical protein HYZ98_02405 [Candidatus Peregrinibacteria bacterium]|nr:hypothetical protein [Candidatus Peregrinibacteria bacterium]